MLFAKKRSFIATERDTRRTFRMRRIVRMRAESRPSWTHPQDRFRRVTKREIESPALDGAPFGEYACPSGPAALGGTGFETHGATGWLETSAPVTPGSTTTLFLAVWDSGDGVLDSTVILDGFAWSTAAVSTPATLPK